MHWLWTMLQKVCEKVKGGSMESARVHANVGSVGHHKPVRVHIAAAGSRVALPDSVAQRTYAESHYEALAQSGVRWFQAQESIQ